MNINIIKVGDVVRISDSKSLRHNKIGVVTYIGGKAYWVKTDDGVDWPVWSCEVAEGEHETNKDE